MSAKVSTKQHACRPEAHHGERSAAWTAPSGAFTWASARSRLSWHHGFTLVELLVVIAIISVLAGLLLPALDKSLEQARLVTCMNQQRQLYLGCYTYTEDADGQLPAWPPGWRDAWMNMVWITSWAFTPDAQLGWGGRLVCQGYGATPELFVCPGREGTQRSAIDSSFNRLLTIDPDLWLQQTSGKGWGHYVIYSQGRFLTEAEKGGVMLAEALNAFGRPNSFTTNAHGRVTWLHGAWPEDLTPYKPKGMHFVGLGTMNMAKWDGSVVSVPDWADSSKYNWAVRDYYWPNNDRQSWGFWSVFRKELE